MEQKNTIELKNLTVAYKDKVIYSDFNACFTEGVNVILGSSGCGKTTLLKAMLGLIPYTGSCILKKPAAVFSEPALSPVSVEKNVRMVMSEKNDELLFGVLERARIADKKDRCAETLSSGEKQRVALARAFAFQREIVLLDEPFSGLDFGVKKQLREVLSSLLENGVKTAVLVTHDIDEALILGDRIYFLSGSPCKMTLEAEINENRNDRRIDEGEYSALRRKLQALF